MIIARIRSILFAIFAIFTMVTYGTLTLLSCLVPIGFHARYRFMVQWPRMLIWGAKWIAGIHLKVVGMEQVPDEPVVFASKHQSIYETLIYPWFLPRDPSFVYKKSLNYVPFFGWSFSRLNHIAIDRTKATEALRQVVEIGKQRLEEGRTVVVFPEGTRVLAGQKGRYQGGAARIAQAAHAKIVPIALNAGVLWERKTFLLRPGVVTLVFGPAISPDDKSVTEITHEIETWIETEQRRLNPELYESAD